MIKVFAFFLERGLEIVWKAILSAGRRASAAEALPKKQMASSNGHHDETVTTIQVFL